MPLKQPPACVSWWLCLVCFLENLKVVLHSTRNTSLLAEGTLYFVQVSSAHSKRGCTVLELMHVTSPAHSLLGHVEPLETHLGTGQDITLV